MLLTPLETKEDREAKAWQKLNNGKYWAKEMQNDMYKEIIKVCPVFNQ
jgi:hypothetical protein